MARKKYMKDYRLVETVDERVRIRTDYEYIGPDLRYARGLETALRERRRALIACGVGALAFLGGLVPRSGASFTLYVILPYVFAALAWAILPACSLVGELVCLLLGKTAMTGGDGVFALCALILSAAGAYAFSRRDAFTPEKP